MACKCVIGVDFGTLSARAVLCRVRDGAVLREASHAYAHGVIDGRLPCGMELPPGWALQHPQDYLDALLEIVPAVLRGSGVDKTDVIGIGVDSTATTIVLVDANGTPLCLLPQYADRPHAWVKLWKHHAAHREADDFTAVAREMDPDLLARNGGRISSETFLPKVLETLREDPEVYRAADAFIDLCDWLTLQMTGSLTRSEAAAGLKAFWRKGIGYPSKALLSALDPNFANVIEDKIKGTLLPLGASCGGLSEAMAEKLGLCGGIAVAVPQLDAHAAVPALGITGPGKTLVTIGTSLGVLLSFPERRSVKGVCSLTEDGDLPGYYAYASGQACAGDLLGWYAGSCGVSHDLLTERAAHLRPGESGLLALDWINGNRSPLVDAELSGMIVGLTLKTRPEDIYRALMESLAFGTRAILEAHETEGIDPGEILACGGIVRKNPLLMQIYADVLGKRIRVSLSDQAPAIGSAMFAATAAGAEKGGHATVFEAARAMHCLSGIAYEPVAAHTAIYTKLYAEYKLLSGYFGRGGNDVMKRLRRLAEESI